MKKEKLSEELLHYGYVFSAKKTVGTFFIMLAGSVLLGIFFHLDMPYILALSLISFCMLPLFLRNFYRNRFLQQKFSDANIYMEQFLYSFMKSGKILTTLTEVEQLFGNGEMKRTIHSAIEYISHTYDSADVEREALQKIERKYDYEGIANMHAFVLQVEKNGGNYTATIRLLLAFRRMWADRTYELIKEKKHQRTKVLLSVITSLLLCSLIYFMAKKMNVMMENEIGQWITMLVLVADMGIFYLADKKLTFGITKKKKMTDEQWQKEYKRFMSYQKKNMIDRIGYSIAKRNLTREIEKVFPKWLMQVSLLLQSENVQVAIFRSYNDAPALLKPALKDFIYELKKSPANIRPYLSFLEEFEVPEVRSAMKMLYSISEGTGGDAESQIEDMIQRNQQLTDKAEKLKNEDSLAGMYMLFLAPQLTGGVKLLADMVILLTVYMKDMAFTL